MPADAAGPIRVVLAAMSPRQRRIVETALAQASLVHRRLGQPEFAVTVEPGRGLDLLRAADGADAVILGLHDDELPGEASHLLTAFPGVKLVGVDADGWARIVVGAVVEPLRYDLATVILWITRREEHLAGTRPRTR